MCQSIELGMKDGTIRKDMDPLEIAIFLMTATQNIVNLSPGFQADLESRGFSYRQYVEDSMNAARAGYRRPRTGGSDQ